MLFFLFFIFVSQDELSAEQSTPPPSSVLFSPRTTEASLCEEFAEQKITNAKNVGNFRGNKFYQMHLKKKIIIAIN